MDDSKRLRTDEFMERALAAHGGSVYRLALASTRSPAEAQDILQETFVSLLTSATAFQDQEHLRAWLLRVAANRCKMFHRSAWRRRETSAEGLQEATGISPFDQAAEEDEGLRMVDELSNHPVWNALAQLPKAQRIAVHLHYVEELPVEQIARITGVPAVTVRTRLHRARNRLRKLLGDFDTKEES